MGHPTLVESMRRQRQQDRLLLRECEGGGIRKVDDVVISIAILLFSPPPTRRPATHFGRLLWWCGAQKGVRPTTTKHRPKGN